jgi:hypothetical protein
VKLLKQKILTFGLLLCFGVAIIPAETFHHHDFKSEICKEDEIHFADHAVDCELASFVIHSFDLPFYVQETGTPYFYKNLIIGDSPKANSELLLVSRGRAPPALV